MSEGRRPTYHLSHLGRPPVARKVQEKSAVPALSYEQAARSWFLYGGQAHNVERCAPHVFKAFIESVTPRRWTRERRAENIVLVASPEDERMLARWYTLEALVKSHVPGLILYPSRCAAEQAQSEEK